MSAFAMSHTESWLAPANRRALHLDGLRGFAAFMVMLHHTVISVDFALYSGLATDSRFVWDLPLSALPITTAGFGDLAVCLFFVLSGYVLALSFSRTRLGLASLVVKRYVRLGLPILAVILVAWALQASGAMSNQHVARLTGAAWLSSQNVYPPDFLGALRDGLYGALVLGHSQYDSSLWTMPIEFQGSLVLIFAFIGCRWMFGPGQRREICCGILLLAFAMLMHGSVLLLFGVGAAAALFNVHKYTENICRRGSVAAMLVFVGLVLGTIPFSQARPDLITWLVEAAPIHHAIPWRRTSPETFWHSMGAILLLMAVDANPALRAWFSRRLLQYLGQISFPLYLVHVPILLSVGCGTYLMGINWQLPVGVAIALGALATWLTSLAAATLLARTVERAAISGSTIAARQVQSCVDGFVSSLYPAVSPAGGGRPVSGSAASAVTPPTRP